MQREVVKHLKSKRLTSLIKSRFYLKENKLMTLKRRLSMRIRMMLSLKLIFSH